MKLNEWILTYHNFISTSRVHSHPHFQARVVLLSERPEDNHTHANLKQVNRHRETVSRQETTKLETRGCDFEENAVHALFDWAA